MTTGDRAWVQSERLPKGVRLIFGGDWTTTEIVPLDAQLHKLVEESSGPIEIDGSELKSLDSAGAWLILRTKRQMEEQGNKVTSLTLPDDYLPMIEIIERDHNAPPVKIPPRRTITKYLADVGEYTLELLVQGRAMLGFLGRVTVEAVQAILRPTREIPWPAFIRQIEETGLNAMPIVGLLSFLIGIVIAYQGADQLRRFGAELFTINLLGVSMLREIGGLMTAIIVAGRSGSAFTAQIGTMKVNQEIDAMQTIGINTVEVLVLPRVLALMITLPLLTFYADVMGLIGGAVMVYFDLGFTTPIYLRQLESAITPNTLWVGMIKAPFFAFLIALVGCFEGLRVKSNAESVGQQTTRAVVESIFLVIVFDAFFSVMFSILGI
jgi:phospholipid/cholesterol/gamma-HCH transport system permease protein